MDLKSIGMGLAFAFMWASAFTSTRVIVVAAPPLTALVIRFTLSAMIGVLLARAMGQTWKLSRNEWRVLIIFGVMQNALYLGLNWIAMRTIEASAAAIIASMMPLLVAFLGWVWLGERLRPMAIAGLILGVLGVAMVMGVRLQHGLDPYGAILALIGVVALTLATLVARGAGGSRNMMMIVALQMAVGAVVLAVPAALTEWGQPIDWSWRLGIAFLYTVLAPGIAATFIWFLLVGRIGAIRAATFHFLSPIFGVTIAAIFLGERFGFSDVIGAGIVAAGILMVQMARLPVDGISVRPPAAPHRDPDSARPNP
ncbi:MAG TPA: DMT family transporter [Paracoccus sp. (in: a-proteobacteria)]|uniref:DMT family transporter n=1 Tax=uncultured Paracoccus sp. TaxID=189685 RepID=UPI00261B8FD8|nr:DMT family transporter [uncultured Paracoccus sp.]HMQ40020.1 DMT family transporter [Paracoccus sp. (in: a-proteobacteria)]HMR37842.1 DMT family transporter [Paracoccus sp. (in: a-proteobacteria)]